MKTGVSVPLLNLEAQYRPIYGELTLERQQAVVAALGEALTT